MERKGIDISKHNGSSVDFNKLKSDGIEFVIIRAGYGKFTSQEDVEFENNYAKAKAAGMPVGAYWYSYATSVDGAVAEANACIEVIKGKQFEYPIYFDLEDPSQSGLGKATLSDMVVAFCETLEAAGYFVGLYANLNWLNNYLDYSKIKNYSIWLAQWSSKPTYKNTFDMWQYTSDGTTSGTPGRTDMNICYRDFPAEIKAGEFNGFGQSTETPSTPAYKPVTDEIVNAVIRGSYGNGDARKQKLESEGYNYSEVQAAVNAKLYTSNKKEVTDTVVNDVIAGKYGNGGTRRQKLEAAGYDYEEVQAAVNAKLGTSSNKKSVTDAIVNAVIRGDYGNGTERKQKLEAAGYDYDEVQSAVNKKLG